MAERLKTPALEEIVNSAPGACRISRWAGSDGFDRSVYEPAKVCIGPFHCPKQPPPSESMKPDALHRFLPHDGQQLRQELRRYLDAMGKIEVRVRKCYSQPFGDITMEEFKRMLLVDGCFLHTRFVPGARPVKPVEDDIKVDRDIIFLLENQLPFFVMEEIHKLITSTPDAAAVENDGDVVDRVLGRVEELLGRSEYSAATVARQFATPPGPPCLLHLLHMYFQPTAVVDGATASTPNGNGAADGNRSSGQAPTPLLQPFWRAVTSYYADGVTFIKQKVGAPASTRTSGGAAPHITISVAPEWSSATYYYAAGVRFMPRKVGTGAGDARSILDVKLRGSTLHVPCLRVDENTFRILRNMVALEQNSSRQLSRSLVTTYCFFLSQLACTVEDVELLVAKKIIVHLLHDADEVAAGLARLCDGTIIDSNDRDRSYPRTEEEALKKLCEDGCMKSMAWLRHHKCSNYFMVLAVVATIAIVVCTIEQSVFAALSYAKGRNS